MKKLKSVSIAIITVFLYLLHLPFALAKSATGVKWFHDPHANKTAKTNSDLPVRNVNRKSVYDSLHLELAGLNRKAFEYAKKGFLKLKEQGRIINDSILSIVDFSQPSSNKRLYILDLKNYKILFNTLLPMEEIPVKNGLTLFQTAPDLTKAAWDFILPKKLMMAKKVTP